MVATAGRPEYDEQGNQTVITYLGLDGKSMSVADGYATLRMAYDSRGKVIQQRFYGVNGEPVQHKGGYYGWEAEYDEHGNQIVETYLDKDGRPMPCADGYVTLRLASRFTRQRDPGDVPRYQRRRGQIHKGWLLWLGGEVRRTGQQDGDLSR